MAIITAGVVMNVLFALATGVWAYWIGLDEDACGVGAVVPGAPAWQAGLEVGDQITQIRGKPVERYKDLKAAVSVGDISGGVPMVVHRPGVPEPLTITVQPRKTKRGPVPTIGIIQPMSPVLHKKLPVLPGTPAAAAKPGFRSGDRIVAIDGKPIDDYAQIHQILALNPDKTLSITVERGGAKGDGGSRAASPGPVERLTMSVAPAPVRQLGMSMKMGKVTAIQRNPPAEAGGIAPGDTITKIDGQPVGDPLTLPDRLRIRAWKEPPGAGVTLTVVRPDTPSPIDVRVSLRRSTCFDPPLFASDPVAVPALGIAYEVLSEVAAVGADGPAAKAGLKPGDVVVKAKLTPPFADRVRQIPYGEQYLDLGFNRPIDADLKATPNGWPALAEAIQKMLPGGTVALTLADNRVVEFQPANAPDRFWPERGFEFNAKTFFSGGQSFALALRLGTRETIDSLTVVYRFLAKLGTRQVDATAFGGPFTIFDMAYHFAALGFADFLIFLTIIGANLAVINFLPIPVLDGGHMVFLAYEGITGKPPSEKVHVALTYLGLLFILGLMLWVLGLDMVRYVPSWLSRIF
jgi:regulator of sigma E protease